MKINQKHFLGKRRRNFISIFNEKSQQNRKRKAVSKCRGRTKLSCCYFVYGTSIDYHVTTVQERLCKVSDFEAKFENRRTVKI